MGISFSMIEKMQGLGLFGKGRISVLDVGSSNLYSASAESIEHFLTNHRVSPSADTKVFAERLAKGSAYDVGTGGTNGAFAGELFEKAGFRYNAIDIADGYGTTILDLNHEAAPKSFVGAFDLVLNFGTTEHLLNQYNAFKFIHDSTKVGGYIVHSLPCVGYSNHGYFTYTPRCMFDLAGYNEYELVAFWFDGPSGNNDLFAPVRDYQSYFPSLIKTNTDQAITEAGRKISELNLPDVGLMVVYRKVKSRPFAGALERSTSVGDVPNSVTNEYETGQQSRKENRQGAHNQGTLGDHSLLSRLRTFFRGDQSNAAPNVSIPHDRHNEIRLEGDAAKLRERFITDGLELDESLLFYNLVVEACGYFPFDWEYRILLLALERDPNRADLAERLALVRSQL